MSSVIGFRVDPEVRAAVDAYCAEHGTTITSVYTALTEMLLTGQIAPGPVQGYKSARELAIGMARVLLAKAAEELPETLAEAQARGLILG